MMWEIWRRDTIARRFVLTITLAFAATFAMNLLFVAVAGVWGRPHITESGILDRAATVVTLVEASPPESRARLAGRASNATYSVEWYADGPPVPLTEKLFGNFPEATALMRDYLGDPVRRFIFLGSKSLEANTPALRYDRKLYPDAQFMGVELADRTWLMFMVPERNWGMTPTQRVLLQFVFLALSIAVFATLTARSLARPIVDLATAVRRFGTDPQAPPIAPSGPRELRATIKAFNTMQAQIARFVGDRTMMLAAISHDLRTPLTRMRLRAEFIDDPEQQAKLFRDVDEMQQMANSALGFFREDAGQEERTAFELSELLLSIVDDYADQAITLRYEGPAKAVYFGRPFTLRRAVVNLVENAIKYATPPILRLTLGQHGIEICVRDDGPGIPDDMTERVFAPFYRMEPSRSRTTGGVGLGLTSVRSIIRAHGGDVTLRNHPAGGCEAVISLPAAEATSEGQ